MKNYQNETNAFIASRTNAYVNKAVRIALNRDDVTSETVRCIYAYIAYHLYGNPRISEPIYCSKIFGHKGNPNVFVNNYNRIFISGIESDEVKEETTEILKETIERLRKEFSY